MSSMWTLIRNGGIVPMSFILVFGAIGLFAAFYFAVRAERRTLGFVKNMALATLFSTLAATCADVGATLFAVERSFDPESTFETLPGPPKPSDAESRRAAHAMHVAAGGLAESASPGILGFSFLAVTFMLVAVGRRRLDERSP
jgi:hypothetical protein